MAQRQRCVHVGHARKIVADGRIVLGNVVERRHGQCETLFGGKLAVVRLQFSKQIRILIR